MEEPVISSKYSVILRDTNFQIVARFDNFSSLSFTKKLNDLGSFSISFPSKDARRSYFKLDGIVQILRSIPSLQIPFYNEFSALHRKDERSISETGEDIYTSSGVGLNDFLARTIINYPKATIKSEKSGPAETVMRDYVRENCGVDARVEPPYERDSYGVLPNFYVGSSSDYGREWEGDRAYENLLDVVRDIAEYGNLDFEVRYNESANRFDFRTYPVLFGRDRSLTNINTSTGLNGAGNVPILFSLERGNVKNIRQIRDRMGESNVVSVLGDGDGATRIVHVVSTSEKLASKWNRREISRPQSGFQSQMIAAGEEFLGERKFKNSVEFQPLQQYSCMYGVHYFLGDVISVSFGDVLEHKKITAVTVSVGVKEEISFVFDQL